MKKRIRHIMGRNIFLWDLWFKAFHKKKIEKKFFRKESKFYIGGFQRSGNTYAAHILRKLLGKDLHFVSHLHKSAVLKKALKIGMPTFVIVRNPLDAVASQYLKHFERGELPAQTDLKVLNKYLEDYYWYHRDVSNLYDDLHIIPFEELISNTKQTIERVLATTGIGEMNDTIFEDAVVSYKGATTKLGSSKPSKFKEQLKSKLKEDLNAHPSFDKVRALHKNIIA